MFFREKGAAVVIDLHTHILPAIDDGSPDVETSIAMLRQEAKQGIDVVCATPHYYANENPISVFCERRADALDQLLANMPDGLPRILPAAEVAFFSGISDCAGLENLCIGHTSVILLEMPFLQWNQHEVDEVISLALDRDYQVILVHPERFCFSASNWHYIEKLMNLPIGLQVNAGSLICWRTRKLTLELLQMTSVPLMGSDCHNLTKRPPNLARARTIVQKKLGKAFLEQMDSSARTLIEEMEWNV